MQEHPPGDANLTRQADMLPRIHPPIVYYAKIKDLVKIGTTTQFKARMSALNVDEVLATEPGGRDLEQARHREFHEWLVGNELFNPNTALQTHIDKLRELHGVPVYTQPVRQPGPPLAVLLKWGHGICVTIPQSVPRGMKKQVLDALAEMELLHHGSTEHRSDRVA